MQSVFELGDILAPGLSHIWTAASASAAYGCNLFDQLACVNPPLHLLLRYGDDKVDFIVHHRAKYDDGIRDFDFQFVS
ncbi:hypothetical protein D3C77_678930 [compost metagenome]